MTNSEQLLEILKTTLQEGKEFILEQAPDIIQEIILWNRTLNTFLAIVFVFGTIIFIILSFVFFKKFKKEESYHYQWSIKDTYGVASALSGIMSLYTTAFFIRCTMCAMKIWFYPKLYLIEYMSYLIK